MILNRTIDAVPFVFGARRRTICAVCGCEGEDWDHWPGHNWIRVAAPAFSGDEEHPAKPGQYLVIELCRDCAIMMGRALASVVAELEQERPQAIVGDAAEKEGISNGAST